MWIPSHVRLIGNELIDERARQVALEGSILNRSLSSSDFQCLAKPALMKEWQAKWDSVDTGLCVCRWLCDSGPLDLAQWKILVGQTSSHWCACRAECEYCDPHSWIQWIQDSIFFLFGLKNRKKHFCKTSLNHLLVTTIYLDFLWDYHSKGTSTMIDYFWASISLSLDNWLWI
jgi:hypothetical protein